MNVFNDVWKYETHAFIARVGLKFHTLFTQI